MPVFFVLLLALPLEVQLTIRGGYGFDKQVWPCHLFLSVKNHQLYLRQNMSWSFCGFSGLKWAWARFLFLYKLDCRPSSIKFSFHKYVLEILNYGGNVTSKPLFTCFRRCINNNSIRSSMRKWCQWAILPTGYIFFPLTLWDYFWYHV